jgi:hypothetical protein
MGGLRFKLRVSGFRFGVGPVKNEKLKIKKARQNGLAHRQGFRAFVSPASGERSFQAAGMPPSIPQARDKDA